jgi:hypothetical protein
MNLKDSGLKEEKNEEPVIGYEVDELIPKNVHEFELPFHLQEPSWFDRKRGFYFGCHASMWRIRFWNALFWLAGMVLIILLYMGGAFGSIANVYLGTAICWIASFIFKETSLTATCLVGTALSIWEGGDILSKYWRVQMGKVD